MRRQGVVTATRWMIVAGIVLEGLVVIGFILGPSGFGMPLPPLGPVQMEGNAVMAVKGTLSVPPEIDLDLTWENTSGGATDRSTGLPAVELVGPYTAGVAFLNPTPVQRAAFVIARIVIPLAVLLILGHLYHMVSAVERGIPFTGENGRRLRTIALVVMIGGTLGVLLSRWLDAWLISTSPAASGFDFGPGPIPLTPLLIGLLLSVLAVVWNRGVALEEDTKGLV